MNSAIEILKKALKNEQEDLKDNEMMRDAEDTDTPMYFIFLGKIVENHKIIESLIKAINVLKEINQ